MAGACAAASDSDDVRALMERAGAVEVEPDQHVFNALLRSEAVASASAGRRDEDAAEDHEDPFSTNAQAKAKAALLLRRRPRTRHAGRRHGGSQAARRRAL